MASFRILMEPLAHEDQGIIALVERLERAAVSLAGAAGGLETAVHEAEIGKTTSLIRTAATAVAEAAHEATGLESELRDSLVPLREALNSIRALADSLEHDPSALVRGRGPELAPGGGN